MLTLRLKLLGSLLSYGLSILREVERLHVVAQAVEAMIDAASSNPVRLPPTFTLHLTLMAKKLTQHWAYIRIATCLAQGRRDKNEGIR
jgi:acyl-CoA thioesterase FadM